MITIPDYPWLVKHSDQKQNFAEVFTLLSDVIRACLLPGDEIYTRKNRGFIAWKRWHSYFDRHGPDLGTRNLYFFWLTSYNSFTFRLRGGYEAEDDLTATFWPPVREARLPYDTLQARALRDRYDYELSF